MFFPLQVSSVFTPGNFQGFALVNRQRSSRITAGFTVEVSTEGTQLSYSNFNQLGQGPHYWQLPESYRGDKVSIQKETTVLLWDQWELPKQGCGPNSTSETCRPLVLYCFVLLLFLTSNLWKFHKHLFHSMCSRTDDATLIPLFALLAVLHRKILPLLVQNELLRYGKISHCLLCWLIVTCSVFM